MDFTPRQHHPPASALQEVGQGIFREVSSKEHDRTKKQLNWTGSWFLQQLRGGLGGGGGGVCALPACGFKTKLACLSGILQTQTLKSIPVTASDHTRKLQRNGCSHSGIMCVFSAWDPLTHHVMPHRTINYPVWSKPLETFKSFIVRSFKVY